MYSNVISTCVRYVYSFSDEIASCGSDCSHLRRLEGTRVLLPPPPCPRQIASQVAPHSAIKLNKLNLLSIMNLRVCHFDHPVLSAGLGCAAASSDSTARMHANIFSATLSATSSCSPTYPWPPLYDDLYQAHFEFHVHHHLKLQSEKPCMTLPPTSLKSYCTFIAAMRALSSSDVVTLCCESSRIACASIKNG